MAGPKAGKSAYLALSTSSTNGTVKSIQGADATLTQEQSDVDVTVWSTAAVEQTLPSFKKQTITFSGPWSSTKDAHLSHIFGTTGCLFVFGPQGHTTGYPKKSGSGYLRTFSIQTPVAGADTFTAEFKITSVVTSTVF